MNESNRNQSVLVVDHHLSTRLKIEDVFRSNGFKTWGSSSGEDALKKALTLSPSTIVIELSLPDMGGLDLCREMRQIHNNWTPIIFISENKDEIDTVLGLELGADDHMTKPLRMKELVARVKSIHRRGFLCCNTPNSMEEKKDLLQIDTFITNGYLAIDPSQFMVYKSGEALEFTRKEFELIYYLLKNKGKAFSRHHLLCMLSTDNSQNDERIIDVFISRIRQKIEPYYRNPTYIKTIRNVGYMMNPISVVADNQPLRGGDDDRSLVKNYINIRE
ncbi:DNA-binding response regulator [Salipaludibacillus neizhouensis]|uniref:DNA-binding response regulator n=1 Tax=Salipaludibacillus neizhouensis TaxID=885475 RepID=A0A3A9KT23_9BACI|nr:response regulator transcription factor [Salipaludibacillus neizhouensis]RKL67796.1 DNA-binding response regulator [Salipaludibacillus neizhouensis]